MKFSTALLPLLAVLLPASANAATDKAELVEVRKIWDQGNHNAFTDLVRFKGSWFCVFREAKAHVSPDGAVRVLTSTDGHQWTSAALLQMPGYDLRDPKISTTGDGKRLMIVGGATVREGSQPSTANQSFVAFAPDGRKWDKIFWAGPTNQWLWRVTWQGGKAYGVSYDVTPASRTAKKYGTTLLRADDGINFVHLVPNLFNTSGPTEATLRFDKDGFGYCLQRRDGATNNTALLGTSRPPYTDWEWRDLGKYFGGPNFIQLPGGRWIAVGRLQNHGTPPATKTVVCDLDTTHGALTPLLTLPSGGDSSYPGLVWHEGQLWISYYSSHEGKTSIYLARVKGL